MDAREFETSWWRIVQRDGQRVYQTSRRNPGLERTLMQSIADPHVLLTDDALPVGALWAELRPQRRGPNDIPRTGQDGKTICMRTLDGGVFFLDARASNCTMKDEHDHRCWVRHGTVGDLLTLDKDGYTCGAGAGSFFMGKDHRWHGFLRNGVCVQA